MTGSDPGEEAVREQRNGLVGRSRAMRELGRFIVRAGASDDTVLIEGTSGTGKELVARALHAQSRRRHGPWIAVNCAALPETLADAELFGHERGAFTGALAARPGKFEQAGDGTLFLDEVGELSLAVQAKLLRVLESREVCRLGGRSSIPVDLRLIAATNRDLRQAIRRGCFREDLYYRLKVLTVSTPPLSSRREDIPLLAAHFLRECSLRAGRPVSGFTPEAMEVLTSHAWPGNVRELRNAIAHAVSMGSAGTVTVEDLPADLIEGRAGAGRAPTGTYRAVLHQTKRRLFETAFETADGDYRKAAEVLGLHPKSIHRHLRRLGLPHLLKRSV